MLARVLIPYGRVDGVYKKHFHLRDQYIGATRSPEGAVLSWRYKLVLGEANDDLPESDGIVTIPTLGSGGFGSVVKVVDVWGVPRAVKLVSSKAYTFGGNEADPRHFLEEFKLTNSRPFQNVCSILDYGRDCEEDGKAFVFYVQPFLPGVNLRTLLNSISEARSKILASDKLRNILHDQILHIIMDVLNGMIELTQASVIHMDIKPANIMVFPVENLKACLGEKAQEVIDEAQFDFCKAWLIDLGASKSLQGEHDDSTICLNTPQYFPIHLEEELGIHPHNGLMCINRSRLRAYGHEIDIFCLGRVLEEIFFNRHVEGVGNEDDLDYLPSRKLEVQKEAFWALIFGDDLELIKFVVKKMVAKPRVGFKSAIMVKSAFSAIPLKSSSSIIDSEHLTDKYPGIYLQTGRSLTRLSKPLFANLVDHPHFQRLRLVQQLAFVSNIFPEGTHNRFAHSVRTFDLAKRFVWGLNRKSIFRFLFDRNKVDELLAAALLHDLGQYPFAHTIEDLRKMGDLTEQARREGKTTDDASYLCGIQHDQDMAAQLFDLESPQSKRTIRRILEENNVNPKNVIYMFQKTEKDAAEPIYLNIARDLISGVIDVDRVSYLIHDSERTGVPYGAAIDSEILAEALTIRWEPKDPNNFEVNGLGIEELGVSAVEAVMMSVHWMYRNVYWRHTNRAFMAVIKWAVRHLLFVNSKWFQVYAEFCYGKTDWECLHFIHAEFEKLIKNSGNLGKWINPRDSLVSLQRIGFRRVCSIRYSPEQAAVYKKLARGITPKREDDLINAIKSSLPSVTAPRHGEILIDVPLKKRFRERPSSGHPSKDLDLDPETIAEAGAKRSKLWVCRRNPVTKERQRWMSLEQYSLVAKVLQSIEDHNGRQIRVFFARSLLDRIASSNGYILARLSGDVEDCISQCIEHWEELY